MVGTYISSHWSVSASPAGHGRAARSVASASRRTLPAGRHQCDRVAPSLGTALCTTAAVLLLLLISATALPLPGMATGGSPLPPTACDDGAAQCGARTVATHAVAACRTTLAAAEEEDSGGTTADLGGNSRAGGTGGLGLSLGGGGAGTGAGPAAAAGSAAAGGGSATLALSSLISQFPGPRSVPVPPLTPFDLVKFSRQTGGQMGRGGGQMGRGGGGGEGGGREKGGSEGGGGPVALFLSAGTGAVVPGGRAVADGGNRGSPPMAVPSAAAVLKGFGQPFGKDVSGGPDGAAGRGGSSGRGEEFLSPEAAAVMAEPAPPGVGPGAWCRRQERGRDAALVANLV